MSCPMNGMNTNFRIARTVFKGLVIASMIALVEYSVIVTFAPMEFQFAARWDGGCNGWNKFWSIFHVIPDSIIWAVYVCIAVAIADLHPVMDRVNNSAVTVTVIWMVFLTCGHTHLNEVWTTFWPLYIHSGVFKWFAAVVGVLGALFISHNLVLASRLVARDRKRLSDVAVDK